MSEADLATCGLITAFCKIEEGLYGSIIKDC